MKTKHTLTCFALAAACAGPAAAAADPPALSHWGTNPAEAMDVIPFFNADDFYFDRVATFTLDGRFDLLARAEVPYPHLLEISAGMVTLWRDNGDSDYRNDELIGGFDFDSTGLQQTFAGIGSGDYFYLVEGFATGRSDLLFSGSIAAVPEPGQWALLLSGLGAIGAFARRRFAA